MKPAGTLPHSQVPATCPYPKPHWSSPYPHIPLPEDPRKITNLFKNTNIGTAFKTTATLHQLVRPTPQIQIPAHKKGGVYKITCNTCHKAYVGQTSRTLRSRFQEHIHHIINNDPCSTYALHILNCWHEYGNINDTMILLKQVDKPNLLLPYEQIYMQSLHHNNGLIPEQQLNELNPIFELLQHKQRTS